MYRLGILKSRFCFAYGRRAAAALTSCIAKMATCLSMGNFRLALVVVLLTLCILTIS